MVDPNDPNHVLGQKVIEDPNTKSTTTIKWNLSSLSGCAQTGHDVMN